MNSSRRRRPFPGTTHAKSSRSGHVKSVALTTIVAVITYTVASSLLLPHVVDRSSSRTTLATERSQRRIEGSVRSSHPHGSQTERHLAREKRQERKAVVREDVDATDPVTESMFTPRAMVETTREPAATVSASTEMYQDDVSSIDGYEAQEWRRIRAAEPPDDECHALPFSDYWGPQRVTHEPPAEPISTPQECCELCKKTEGCHFWRHDPSAPGECFTGKLFRRYLAPMYGRTHDKKTTSGVLYPDVPKYDAESTELKTCLHTMITSNGSPYMNWQTRVFYETWRRAASEPGSILRHFTRILHRSSDDDLVQMIPTWRVDPTNPSCDVGCDYAVKDRARAIAQWMETADSKQCSHILMAETDYLFIRSPPPSVILAKGFSYGFLFAYIDPPHQTAKEASVLMHSIEKDGPLKDVPQTGNAPQAIHRDDLERVAPVWADKVEFGETNALIKRIYGWVRDMYAWSFASVAVRPKMQYELPPVPFQKLVIQPPADISIGQASLMHYTWGSIIKDKDGEVVWEFDKRSYRGSYNDLRKIDAMPDWDPERGFKLQDDQVMQESQFEVLRKMVEVFNGAVDALQKR